MIAKLGICGCLSLVASPFESRLRSQNNKDLGMSGEYDVLTNQPVVIDNVCLSFQ